MKVDVITILELARDGELKPKTILRTKHEKQYFDDRDYDYYIYYGDNQFHRCDENGKLGAKYQTRFLNYEVLNKEFELILPEEDKEIDKYHNYQYSEIPPWFREEELIKCINNNFEVHQKAIYKLIDEVNKLKRGE